MKNQALLVISLLMALLTFQFCASQNKNGIKMAGDPQPWGNQDMLRLANWQHLEYHKVKFTGKELKGKNWMIVYKEIWYGKVNKVDTLFNTKNNSFAGPLKEDTLSFAVMGGRSGAKSLKTEFFFDRFAVNHDYIAVNSDDYSLRILDRQSNIETGKPFYAFAYILPYEKDGFKYYCAVEGSGKDVEKWGNEFDIEHYILFEMTFF
ncbi:MAG: hypothetical protein EOO45_26120 [Flavobacterium sp.]|nr:MAG: hypothetical protein EOO45_26120 [Flavobacterium sp.]